MMWKLFHFIFGWDYVYWENPNTYKLCGVSRIYKDGFGIPYIIIKIPDTDYTYKIYLHLTPDVCKYYSIMWLTCTPQKYKGEKK